MTSCRCPCVCLCSVAGRYRGRPYAGGQSDVTPNPAQVQHQPDNDAGGNIRLRDERLSAMPRSQGLIPVLVGCFPASASPCCTICSLRSCLVHGVSVWHAYGLRGIMVLPLFCVVDVMLFTCGRGAFLYMRPKMFSGI